jgi:hypothetical protein
MSDKDTAFAPESPQMTAFAFRDELAAHSQRFGSRSGRAASETPYQRSLMFASIVARLVSAASSGTLSCTSE